MKDGREKLSKNIVAIEAREKDITMGWNYAVPRIHRELGISIKTGWYYDRGSLRLLDRDVLEIFYQFIYSINFFCFLNQMSFLVETQLPAVYQHWIYSFSFRTPVYFGNRRGHSVIDISMQTFFLQTLKVLNSSPFFYLLKKKMTRSMFLR